MVSLEQISWVLRNHNDVISQVKVVDGRVYPKLDAWIDPERPLSRPHPPPYGIRIPHAKSCTGLGGWVNWSVNPACVEFEAFAVIFSPGGTR